MSGFNLNPGTKGEVTAPTIQVDLIVESHNEMNFSNSGGLRTTHYLQNSLMYYPALHSLTVFLKMFLNSKGLGSSYTGKF